MRLRLTTLAVAATALFLLPGGPVGAQDPSTQARAIDNELNRLQSRVGAPSASSTSQLLTERDRRIANQQLQSLKTRAPGERSIPLLERRTDRLSRPGRSSRRR